MFGGRGSWGSHYPNGAVVLTKFPDGIGLAVVIENSGDCHHQSFRARVENNRSTPRGKVRLVGYPDDGWTSYWMGPIVAELTMAQVMRLAGGLVVPKFSMELSAEDLRKIEGDGNPVHGNHMPRKSS